MPARAGNPRENARPAQAVGEPARPWSSVCRWQVFVDSLAFSERKECPKFAELAIHEEFYVLHVFTGRFTDWPLLWTGKM